METKKLSKRKIQSAQTREKLLNAGRETFIEYGFQKTTISQIIKKAETGYGTAYVYFKNKDDILIELMEDVMAKFYEIANMTYEPKSKEEAYTLIEQQSILFLDMAIKEKLMMQVIEEAIRLSDNVRTKWTEIREQFINRIGEDIAYAQKNELARNDVNCSIVARAWFHANEVYLWEIVKDNNPPSIREIVHNIASIYTGGLYK
ncbi:TetR/AcrR family transcriptional regulator [Chengkuizengella axinellae]|uniref:TetR/AcrR family transcriptional regulator n=1 Tax=Chengkuizengella axinellae TaxID=3064388 RepID=A0ABT9IU36_9BACL|nr:TetR/AcrR family transcriptional regulator [Chengkuizengella sp. 2205SS18-9]MDP5272858.1 TetR/AcrR family transcriptional regulator [Chengkuizengella sp. 2205SS18-9]